MTKLEYSAAAGFALAAAIVAVLTGCAALPETSPAVAVKAQSSLASAQSFTAPTATWPAAGWWRAYGDAQLDTLVEEGLAGSPSIAQADARLQRAEAYRATARGALLPQAGINSSITAQKQSYTYLSPPAMTPQGWNDYGRSTLDISWELDFWGKNRAALAAATSEAAAARADADQARLALSAAIASDYAELARQYAALDTAIAA